MPRPAPRIVPLKRAHVRACTAIVAGSQPWKRLGEGIDFAALLRRTGRPTAASVCMIADAVAGFILFNPEPVFARGGYLRALGVSPEYRRQGVGSLLLSFAEAETAQQARHMFLSVSSFNRSAQAFYRDCGYQKVGSVPGLIIPDQSELLYWKRLRHRR